MRKKARTHAERQGGILKRILGIRCSSETGVKNELEADSVLRAAKESSRRSGCLSGYGASNDK